MKVELKLVFNWICISLLVIILGLLLSSQTSSKGSDIIWDENVSQEVADYLLNEDQTIGIKEVFDKHKVIISNTTKELSHLIIIMTIAISCGIWGGIAAYTMTFVENLSDETLLKEGKVVEEKVVFFNNYNRNNLHASILVGIVASSMVPLFLSVIGSDHLAIKNMPSSYLLIIGFCLLAAVFSRQFITKLAEKAINQKFNALESEQSNTKDRLDKTLSELSISSSELATQRKLNIDNSFKIAVVEAQEHFSKFKAIKSKHTNTNKPKPWEPIEDIPAEDDILCKQSLEKAMGKIDDALKLRASVRATCMKGNYLRQLYMLTEEDQHLQAALDLLTNIATNEDILDYNEYSGGMFWNIATYSILLNKQESPKELAKIIAALEKALSINEEVFSSYLREDKDLSPIRDESLFKEAFANKL